MPRRDGGAEIPRTIHRIWLGDAEMPEEHRHWGEGWAVHHPGWEVKTWGNEEYERLVPAAARGRARQWSEASDLLRYEILAREGGVYVDTDVECRRPLEELLEGITAFAAWEAPQRVGTSVLGAVPRHPAFAEAAREARETVGLGPDSAFSTGPGFLTVVLADYPDVTLFDSSLFYPYGWDEPRPPDDAFDGAYAVHHWAGATTRSA
jgi:mannosyltransferase OCH1-like enzyme